MDVGHIDTEYALIAGIILTFLILVALVIAVWLRGWRMPPPWNTELRPPPKGMLLVYDAAIPQPYMVKLPVSELRQHLGHRQELRCGKKSMWACERDGEQIDPLGLVRDTRTNRTPPFLREYMRLRSVKNNLSRPPDKIQRAMMLGGSVAVVVTVVAGLFLITAVS